MTQAQQAHGRMLDVARAEAQAPAPGSPAAAPRVPGRLQIQDHHSDLVDGHILERASWSAHFHRARAYAHQNRTAAGHLGAVAQSGRSSVNHNIVEATDAQQLPAYDGRNRQ